MTSDERREELKAVFKVARDCTRCPQLAASRTTVVFGAGNADADLMFVGEAPGANEDKQGLPFVGQAGRLLETLLGEIGLRREDVFIQNTLMCRPPGNRDPQPAEIANCSGYLLRKIELVRPRVICTLGNFATKLLRDDPTGITRLHGRPEDRRIGNLDVISTPPSPPPRRRTRRRCSRRCAPTPPASRRSWSRQRRRSPSLSPKLRCSWACSETDLTLTRRRCTGRVARREPEDEPHCC